MKKEIGDESWLERETSSIECFLGCFLVRFFLRFGSLLDLIGSPDLGSNASAQVKLLELLLDRPMRVMN